MAVRQYVGARYVPKFYENSTDPSSTQWEENRSYEALVVVSYNNETYTSKIPVPAGVGNPASNPTYWARTGAYNTQVEQYRQEVETVTTDVDEKLQQTQDTVNEVNKKIDNLSIGHTYILVGDSFGAGINGDNNTTVVEGGGWIPRFINATSGYATVYTAYTEVAGASGFAAVEPFLTQLKNAEKKVPNNASITDIIVLGGTNDQNGGASEATIEAGVQEFCTYCKTNFKNASIKIGLLGTLALGFNDAVITGYKSCTKYGASYLATSKNLFCDKSMMGADNIHLTKAGYDYYQPYINWLILSGSIDYTFSSYSDCTINETPCIINTTVTANTYSFQLINDKLYGVEVTSTSELTDKAELGTITNDKLTHRPNYYQGPFCPFFYRKQSEAENFPITFAGMGTFYIVDDKILFRRSSDAQAPWKDGYNWVWPVESSVMVYSV